jgi:hypothetical protein
MGLVLDSGVPIAAERVGKPVRELMAVLEHLHGETEIVLSTGPGWRFRVANDAPQLI